MASTEAKADLSNWMKSPHSQWAFVNVDQILHTDLVEKAEDAGVLESDLRQFDDFKIEWEGKSFDLSDYLSDTCGNGLIVLQHGKIVYETYACGNKQDSKHIIMSITKSVTAFLVGILQDQGKLHVDDLVTKYVPEVSGTFYKHVTIQQCIDMRSGCHYQDGKHESRVASGWNPEDGSEKYTNIHDFIANFHPPAQDDRFDYVSVNTDLIGWVIERVAGKRYGQVLQELLWQPMGAESDALVTTDKIGNARAAGGICATLRDIARIGQLIVDDGRDVVPSSWLEDVVHGGDPEAFARGAWAAGFQKTGIFHGLSYRNHCLVDRPTEVVMGLGVHGQMLFADRKNRIVVVQTGSQPGAIDFRYTAKTMMAFQEFRRILLAS